MKNVCFFLKFHTLYLLPETQVLDKPSLLIVVWKMCIVFYLENIAILTGQNQSCIIFENTYFNGIRSGNIHAIDFQPETKTNLVNF